MYQNNNWSKLKKLKSSDNNNCFIFSSFILFVYQILHDLNYKKPFISNDVIPGTGLACIRCLFGGFARSLSEQERRMRPGFASSSTVFKWKQTKHTFKHTMQQNKTLNNIRKSTPDLT